MVDLFARSSWGLMHMFEAGALLLLTGVLSVAALAGVVVAARASWGHRKR